MKVIIEEDKNLNATEVLVRCKTRDDEINRLVQHIRNCKEKLICYEDKTIHYIEYNDIFY